MGIQIGHVRPKRTLSVCLVSVGAIVFSGCADLNNVSEILSLNPGLKAFAYSDDLQNTFVKKTPGGFRMCSQPDADAGASYDDGIELEAGAAKSDGLGMKNSVVGSSLGGRNPEVLIVRELMFRACELSTNYDVSYKEARSIYSEFLQAAVSMSDKQTGTGAAAVGGSISSQQNISSGASSDDSDSDK